ncbi:MAG: methionine--tRNA ligase [Candidatus Altiarchaeota archaeon]
MPKERILVTAALPYANGPVHVGHAIGCYIPADVYTRYNRMAGRDILYICGTDEHGTPITVTAEQEGVTPKEVVDKYHKIQAEAFKSIGVEFDNFSGTARPIHYKISQDFFLKALKNGHVVKKTVERPYCPNCKRFLPDRYVKGVCPNCGSPDQRGDVCEACGKQLEPHELKEAYCSICGNPPEVRETTHWFFKLGDFSERLKKWITQECKHWPANARNFALGWINEGLQDRAITRDLSWGIPLPEKDLDGNLIEGREGKVLYVWFDAPIGYISSTKEWAERNRKGELWRDYWTKPSKIVHFIGKDNIPFHTIIWPATLMAEGSYALPWQVASNEFLNLEGRKVSTSRNWVIWLHDIAKEFNPDAVRYYLLSIAPEAHDSDFHLEEFQHKVNVELIGTFGNFINRTLTFIKQKKNGIIPKPAGKYDERDEELMQDINQLSEFIGAEALDKFAFKMGLERMISRAAAANVYFQGKEPWKNENDTTLFLCANLIRSLAIVMYPFLPSSAEKVWKMLNLPGKVSEQRWEDAGRMDEKLGGHRIGEVDVLFKKIEDDQIKAFREAYLHTKPKKKEGKKMIEFSDFEKMDLRVGVVKEVEDHPSAEKLVVLKVDLGDLGERQIVAGIRKDYDKSKLKGKNIIVVANLKPVKLRGIMSEGMLLAAVDDDKVNILTTDRQSKAGAEIK